MAYLSTYITPRGVPYFTLECTKAFGLLTQRERLYLHHFSHACWGGLGIVASQVSAESKDLLCFILRFFTANPPASIKGLVGSSEKITEQAVSDFFEYCALVYSNAGNYKSFGDTKFVPALKKEEMRAIVAASPNKQEELGKELDLLIDRMYDIGTEEDRHVLSLGFGPHSGVSSYYSAEVEADVVAAIDAVLSTNPVVRRSLDNDTLVPLYLENTRIFKLENGVYEVRIASAHLSQEPSVIYIDKAAKKLVSVCGTDKPAPQAADVIKVKVRRGDHYEALRYIVQELREAQKYVANEVQEHMISSYIESFLDGSIEAHKDSQRLWVRDQGPIVETNIGFIENYRDPAGVRAEYEGFVAIVNKEESEKYAKLVAHSHQFIPLLPWGAEFEKETFQSPDFTSLEVFAFASSGVPLGINIPNYDDIRQNFGFKNVYLSNCGRMFNPNDRPNHIMDRDWEVYRDYYVRSMLVGVACHELLGHGSGKLLAEDENGKLNFDPERVKNPYAADGRVKTWYRRGETWSSIFGAFSNPIEECRAEAVSLYLSLSAELQHILLPDSSSTSDFDGIVRVNWLSMVRSGLVSLEMYTPEKRIWGQAHCRARFCILQVLLRAGQTEHSVEEISTKPASQFYNKSQINGANPRSIVQITHDASKSLLEITVDETRIATEGKAAIGELLRRLNIYKAMADAEAGIALFKELTEVSDECLALRETIMKLRKPRKETVQNHTQLVLENDGQSKEVKIIEFEASKEGQLEAMVRRHKDIPIL